MAAIGKPLISKPLISQPSPQAVWATLRKDWLIKLEDGQNHLQHPLAALSCESWFSLVESRRIQLTQRSDKQLKNKQPKTEQPKTERPLVLLAESDPVHFLAGFWAALLADWDITLANPHWGTQEWASVSQLIHPTVIWSDPSGPIITAFNGPHQTLRPQPNPLAKILIPTGGTSGSVKLTCHSWATLLTAVTGFQNHFAPDGSTINSYCVLPLYHVSGLMQALRTWHSGGQLVIGHFKSLLSYPLSKLEAPSLPQLDNSFVSLVPTQLTRLMQSGFAPWLSQFRGVLLGGAPPWPSLLTRAKAHGIPLCLSYGMTETAAMVTAQRTQDFLQGDLSSGHMMPHATVRIEQEGQVLRDGSVGQVVVCSGAIAHNYHNAPSKRFHTGLSTNAFYTDDLGYLDTDGQLHITGRASRKIISGGENIFPDEVEAKLRDTGQVADVYVLGLPHPDWGEIVTAVYVPATKSITPTQLKDCLLTADQQLSRYKIPQQWIALPALPRNAQGKLNHAALIEQLSAQKLNGASD
ncbi:MAG: AMP-binding protein [Cyanobacteria bacterium J06607_10]